MTALLLLALSACGTPEPIRDDGWSPPPVRPFPDVPVSTSKMPTSIPSTAGMVRAETLKRYRTLGPPGPATRWLAEGDPFDMEDKQRRRQRYQEEHDPIRWLPHMQALTSLTWHVNRYRQSAEFAGAIELALALKDRELELLGLGYDGELPAEYVQEHACAWVGVAAACQLPPDVSCVAAEELDTVARRLCAEPSANLLDENVEPSHALEYQVR